jgi:hypothetical protein
MVFLVKMGKKGVKKGGKKGGYKAKAAGMGLEKGG